MGVFAHKGLRTREVRAPFVFGLAAWLLAVVHEVSYPFLFNDRAGELVIVLEETLEFGGSLLIVASAAIALGQSRCAAQVFASRRLGMLLGGSLAAVGVLGGLIIACVFRAPVVDARAETHIGAFHIGLSDQEAVAQEFRMPAVPIGRFMLRIVNQDSQARPATVKLRITDADIQNP